MYLIEPTDADAEKAWLHTMQVYPAIQDYYDWIQDKMYVRIGLIVAPDTALAVKLRHPLQFQGEYTRK